MDLEADIDAMLSGFDSVAVVHGSVTSKGVANLVDSSMLPGVTSALGEIRTVTVRTAAFPGLKTNDYIVVDGVDYKVLDRRREDDGRVSHLILGTP